MARGQQIIINTIIVKSSPCVIENRYIQWSNSRNSVALLLSAMNLRRGEIIVQVCKKSVSRNESQPGISLFEPRCAGHETKPTQPSHHNLISPPDNNRDRERKNDLSEIVSPLSQKELQIAVLHVRHNNKIPPLLPELCIVIVMVGS